MVSDDTLAYIARLESSLAAERQARARERDAVGVKIVSISHLLTAPYSFPFSTEEDMHRRVTAYAKAARCSHPEMAGDFTVSLFYAPSWDAWCRAMGPALVNSETIRIDALTAEGGGEGG